MLPTDDDEEFKRLSTPLPGAPVQQVPAWTPPEPTPSPAPAAPSVFDSIAADKSARALSKVAPGGLDGFATGVNPVGPAAPLPDYQVVPGAAGGAPGPPIPPAMPATRTTSNRDVSTTTTSSKPTAGEAVALGGAQNAIEERRAANTSIGDVGTAQSQAAALSAGQAAEHQARREEELARLQKARDAAYQRNQADERKLYDEYKKKSTEEVLPDGLGTQILSRLAMALGAYGAAVNGGPNQAAQIIQEKTRASYQKHKDQIENARQLYADKHGTNAEADAHFDVLERNLNTRFAAGLDKLQAKGVQMQLQAGVPLAKAQADASNAALAQESAQLKVANEQLNREHVTKTINNRSVTVTDSGGVDGRGGRPGTKGGGPIYARDNHGNVTGTYDSVKIKAEAARVDSEMARTEDQLKELIASEKKGRVFNPFGSDYQERETAAAGATIGVAAVSPLGKNEESTRIEKGTLGNTTGNLFTPPNVHAAEKKLREIQALREAKRREFITPLSGEEEIRSSGPGFASEGGGPESNHNGALEWLQTKGKLPENRNKAIIAAKKLKAAGVIR